MNKFARAMKEYAPCHVYGYMVCGFFYFLLYMTNNRLFAVRDMSNVDRGIYTSFGAIFFDGEIEHLVYETE